MKKTLVTVAYTHLGHTAYKKLTTDL